MEAALPILEKYLAKQKRFTLTEAAAATGLSIDESRSVLDDLMQKYIARLQVTENGDLIYDFGKSLRRWGQKTFAERREAALDVGWKIFKIAFKTWITITLVVYFIIFVVILLALLFANSSDKKGKHSSFDVSGIMHIFLSIFRWNTASGNTVFRTDDRGYRYREYEPLPSVIKKNKKSFISAVYDFVFGPPRVEPDPLNNQKEAAAFLNRKKGVIVMSELEALAGWTHHQAQQFFSECLMRFDGEAKVSENGAVYGEFNNIIRGIGKSNENQIIYYWDEYEPEYELNGNSSTQNMWIMIMNSFNLIFSFVVLAGNFSGGGGGLVAALLSSKLLMGWIPFMFSMLFFAVPLVRYFQIRSARQRRHHNNIRKRMFRIIYQSDGASQPLEAIQYAVNDKATEETLSRDTTETLLNELISELEGQTELKDNGKLLYTFPRIKLEMAEVKQIRSGHAPPGALGEIIMDTKI